MPALIRDRDKPVLKTPFLTALDAVGNSSSKQELMFIRKALQSKVPLIDLFGQLSVGKGLVGTREVNHVARDWFDAPSTPRARPPAKRAKKKAR